VLNSFLGVPGDEMFLISSGTCEVTTFKAAPSPSSSPLSPSYQAVGAGGNETSLSISPDSSSSLPLEECESQSSVFPKLNTQEIGAKVSALLQRATPSPQALRRNPFWTSSSRKVLPRPEVIPESSAEVNVEEEENTEEARGGIRRRVEKATFNRDEEGQQDLENSGGSDRKEEGNRYVFESVGFLYQSKTINMPKK